MKEWSTCKGRGGGGGEKGKAGRGGREGGEGRLELDSEYC